MPRYDYICDACGHKMEVTHGINDTGPLKCPNCGKLKLRKGISVPAVHLHYSPMHPRFGRGRGR